MIKMNLCRNKRGGLFLCDYYTVYNKKEDIWTNCIANPDGRLFPEVTFENSPQEVELKLCNSIEKVDLTNKEHNIKTQPCVLTNNGIDTNVVKFD